MGHDPRWIICPGRPGGLAVLALVCRVQLRRFDFDCQVRGSQLPWTVEMLLHVKDGKEHLTNEEGQLLSL